MNIQITNEARSEYSFSIQATCGKKEVFVSIGSTVSVCQTNNASHRAWRGAGRTFWSLQEALAAYKSPEIKAVIDLAARRNIETQAV